MDGFPCDSIDFKKIYDQVCKTDVKIFSNEELLDEHSLRRRKYVFVMSITEIPRSSNAMVMLIYIVSPASSSLVNTE